MKDGCAMERNFWSFYFTSLEFPITELSPFGDGLVSPFVLSLSKHERHSPFDKAQGERV